MRRPMVNRTFHITRANLLCVNLDTQQTEQKEFAFAKILKDKRDILRVAIRSDVVPSNLHVVDVISFTHENKKYAMSEDTFISHATQITD